MTRSLPLCWVLWVCGRYSHTSPGHVDVAGPHDADLAGPGAGQALQLDHGADRRQDEGQRRLHHGVGDRLDRLRLAGLGAALLQPAHRRQRAPGASPGPFPRATAHLNMRTIRPMRWLTTPRHRSASIIRCRTALSFSGEKSAAGVGPYSSRSGRSGQLVVAQLVRGRAVLVAVVLLGVAPERQDQLVDGRRRAVLGRCGQASAVGQPFGDEAVVGVPRVGRRPCAARPARGRGSGPSRRG